MRTITTKSDILKDIRFWIVFFFVVRLIGITNPPLEVGHNWRQTTVTMVARNFLEVDNNILYPRIDIAGEKTGITGMEFPILNYLIYLSAEVFGYQHWYGRLINLLISSFGLFYFYKILRKYYTESIAFLSTIILAVSIWFQFSRKIMPDTFSMSLLLAAIYYGTNYLDSINRKRAWFQLACYAILMSLSVLSKLPSGYLLVIFSLFIVNRDIPLKRKTLFVITSLIGFIPIVFWYYHWVPFLVEKFEFWHFFMGKGVVQGFSEIGHNLNDTLSKFYDTALKFIGFGLFLFGLINAVIKKDKRIYFPFLLSSICFALVVFKAGYTFAHHNYYVIPFVPVMALIAGYGLSKIKVTKLALMLLVAICIEGIANQQHDFRIKDKDMKLLNLEADLDSISTRSDLILINSGDFPTPMYFAHRKGWVNTNERITDQAYIDELKSLGLKYIVILKKAFGAEVLLYGYDKVLDKKDYAIYKVE